MHINQPGKNMQDDVAAFEAWALILHANLKDGIEMTFDILPQWESSFSPEKRIDAELQHFMRFLFRVWKFQDQIDWFSIKDERCRLCVQKFKDLFLEGKTTNNIPLDDAKDVDLEEKPKLEYLIENIFVNSKMAIEAIEFINKSITFIIPDTLFNQLPTGLFIASHEKDDEKFVCDKNRFFPTGFFDLWGINRKNELCIFELKHQNNTKAGILSELYFYANYANDIFLTDRFNEGNSTHRGYDFLKKAVATEGGIPKIHACFLAPRYHSQISGRENVFQTLLNNGIDKIDYHFLTFQQDEIMEFKDCLLPK